MHAPLNLSLWLKVTKNVLFQKGGTRRPVNTRSNNGNTIQGQIFRKVSIPTIFGQYSGNIEAILFPILPPNNG